MSKYISGIKNATFSLGSGGVAASTNIPLLSNTTGVYVGLNNNSSAAVELNASGVTSTSYIDFTRIGIDYMGRILYDHATDQMKFYTNTVDQMNINSTGVGIGGLANYKLQVYGDITTTAGNIYVDQNYSLSFQTGVTNNTINYSTIDTVLHYNASYKHQFYVNSQPVISFAGGVVNIAPGSYLNTANIDSATGTTSIGYYSPKILTQRASLAIYNNLTDRNILLSVNSAGTSSGIDNIVINAPMQINNNITLLPNLYISFAVGWTFAYDTYDNSIHYDSQGAHSFFVSGINKLNITTNGVYISDSTIVDLTSSLITSININNSNTINANIINTTGNISIAPLSYLLTNNIDSSTGSVLVGYNTHKQATLTTTFGVYNNSTDLNMLFSVNSVGTTSGVNSVIVNAPLQVNNNIIMTNNAYIRFIAGYSFTYNTPTTSINYDSAGSHIFNVNGVSQMTINSSGVTIPNAIITNLTTSGNFTMSNGYISTTNIDSPSSMLSIGEYTTKLSSANPTFAVYNNSTDNNLLFTVNSAGTQSGVNSVSINTSLNLNNNMIMQANSYIQFTPSSTIMYNNLTSSMQYDSNTTHIFNIASFNKLIISSTGVFMPAATINTLTSTNITSSAISTSTLNTTTINSSGAITIASGNSLNTTNIDSVTGTISLGYYTPKQTNLFNILSVYNNSTDLKLLFGVGSPGTASGSNNVVVNAPLKVTDNILLSSDYSLVLTFGYGIKYSTMLNAITYDSLSSHIFNINSGNQLVINSSGVTITNASINFITNTSMTTGYIDSLTSILSIGYNTVKLATQTSVLNVYNNLTDRVSLLKVNSAGTASGINNVIINAALYANSSINLLGGTILSFEATTANKIHYDTSLTQISYDATSAHSFYINSINQLYMNSSGVLITNANIQNLVSNITTITSSLSLNANIPISFGGTLNAIRYITGSAMRYDADIAHSFYIANSGSNIMTITGSGVNIPVLTVTNSINLVSSNAYISFLNSNTDKIYHDISTNALTYGAIYQHLFNINNVAQLTIASTGVSITNLNVTNLTATNYNPSVFTPGSIITGNITSSQIYVSYIDTTSGTITLGYNSPKSTSGTVLLSVYNNSTDHNSLLSVTSAGTSSGANSVNVNALLYVNNNISMPLNSYIQLGAPGISIAYYTADTAFHFDIPTAGTYKFYVSTVNMFYINSTAVYAPYLVSNTLEVSNCINLTSATPYINFQNGTTANRIHYDVNNIMQYDASISHNFNINGSVALSISSGLVTTGALSASSIAVSGSITINSGLYLPHDQMISFEASNVTNLKYVATTDSLSYNAFKYHNFYINNVSQMYMSSTGVTIPTLNVTTLNATNFNPGNFTPSSISTGMITISAGNSLFTQNIDSNSGNVAIGYYTVKPSAQNAIFSVYNNSTDLSALLSVYTSGTSSGVNNIVLNATTFANYGLYLPHDQMISFESSNVTNIQYVATTDSLSYNAFGHHNFYIHNISQMQINSTGVVIPILNALLITTQNIDSNSGNVAIGYYTTKLATQNNVFSVYNNSTDHTPLFNVYSSGTSSGTNNIILNTTTTANYGLYLPHDQMISFEASNATNIKYVATTDSLSYNAFKYHNFYINNVSQMYMSSTGVVIPVLNSSRIITSNIDSNTGNVAIGYYTTKPTTGTAIFSVYNNSTDLSLLFSVNTAGSSTGVNGVNINTILNVNNTFSVNSTGCTASNVYISAGGVVNFRPSATTDKIFYALYNSIYTLNYYASNVHLFAVNAVAQATITTNGLIMTNNITMNNYPLVFDTLTGAQNIACVSNHLKYTSNNAHDFFAGGVSQLYITAGTVYVNTALNAPNIVTSTIGLTNVLNMNSTNRIVLDADRGGNNKIRYQPEVGYGQSLNYDTGDSHRFYVNSSQNFQVTSSGVNAPSFNNSSDMRIKTNNELIDNASDLIMALNPIRYNYIDPRQNTKKKYGVIAQEAELILPDCVNTSSDFIPNIMKSATKISIRSFQIDATLNIGIVRAYLTTNGIETTVNLRILSVVNNVYTINADLICDSIFIFGEFVNDFKSVEYTLFIPILMQGFKVQENRIKTLEAQVALLMSKM